MCERTCSFCTSSSGDHAVACKPANLADSVWYGAFPRTFDIMIVNLLE